MRPRRHCGRGVVIVLVVVVVGGGGIVVGGVGVVCFVLVAVAKSAKSFPDG